MTGSKRPAQEFSLVLILLVLACCSVFPSSAQESDGFPAWLSGVREEALATGIGEGVLDEALGALEFDPEVIDLEGKQPEFTLTYQRYAAQRLSDWRIKKGQEMMAAHKAELEEVGAVYGVQPRFIVAIWGLETNYGNYIGGHNVIRSLASLAYAAPRDSRKAFFRKELVTALKILNEGHISFAAMEGSWAGAMGQGQFMPSSFYTYAQDFNGDGRRDIWTDYKDIFASIAYYLQRHNWQADYTWGREVTLPAGFQAIANGLGSANPDAGCRAERSHLKSLSLKEWNDLGLKRLNGTDLPTTDISARLVQPDGDGGPAYLVYDNFVRILRYNCSNFYALVVGRLSDHFKGAP